MCGIFGAWPARDNPLMERCAKRLAHRGPDGFGSYIAPEGEVYLALCRLAIIDLSERGRQPMSNEDGTIWITFNGEIYNFPALRKELLALGHEFRSETDTEVIVHGYEEWGPSCVDRLRGMFAFCIWDSVTRTLFLARDRMGIKPLYYCHKPGRFAFASEIKALLELPWIDRAISFAAVCQYMQHGYISGTQSIWRDIEQLSPGHHMTVALDDGSREIVRYWELDGRTKPWTEREALGRLEELLTSSVTEHLISDVPVGVFLSGGVDSSIIVSEAATASPHIDSFSIGFEGWEGNELQAARSVARHYGTNHHEGMITKDSLPHLRHVYAAFDQPLADSSVIPTHLLCEMARRTTTVALSGDGGDELFGGYTWYRDVQTTPRKRLSWFAERVRRGMSIGHDWPYGCADQLEQFGLLTCPSFSVPEIMGLFPELVPSGSAPASLAASALFQPYCRADLDPVKRWQNVDVNAFLVDDNLVRVDRCSMVNSLEVRVPLLDHRLAEFAFSLPDDLRLRGSETKYLLRRALEHRLPQELLNRPKQGFSFPIDRYWPLEEMVDELRQGVMQREGFIHRSMLESVLSDRRQPNWPLKVRLLAVLERWCSQWLLGDIKSNVWHPASDAPLHVQHGV